MTVATLTAVAGPPAGATTRVAAFDGMRGVACLLVVVSHYFGHGYSFSRLVEGSGAVGVMMFFVLSGYLIGGILIDHRDSPSYFRTFYLRRAFRIFPIYYVVIGLSPLAMAVCAWTAQYFSLWSYLTYTVNFSMAFSGEYGNALLVPVWSLCIEEQFYLLFPLLLYALPRHWRLERVLLVLIVLAVFCRCVLAGAGANELYGKMLLPTRMDALALGVLAAHVRRTPALRHWLSQDNSSRDKAVYDRRLADIACPERCRKLHRYSGLGWPRFSRSWCELCRVDLVDRRRCARGKAVAFAALMFLWDDLVLSLPDPPADIVRVAGAHPWRNSAQFHPRAGVARADGGNRIGLRGIGRDRLSLVDFL